jgi:hypothetical protein
MKKIIYLTLFLLGYSVYGQLSTKEKPVSLKRNIPPLNISENTRKILPHLDMSKISKEDEEGKINGLPPSFSFPHEVSYI